MTIVHCESIIDRETLTYFLSVISEESEEHKVDDLLAYLSYMNVHRLYRVFHTLGEKEVKEFWNERLVSQTWIHVQVSNNSHKLLCAEFIARLDHLMLSDMELSKVMSKR